MRCSPSTVTLPSPLRCSCTTFRTSTPPYSPPNCWLLSRWACHAPLIATEGVAQVAFLCISVNMVLLHENVLERWMQGKPALDCESCNWARNQPLHNVSACNEWPARTGGAAPPALSQAQVSSGWWVQATVATITELQAEAGVTDVSLLNFVVSDGATLVATRYVSREDCPAATMYYAQGACPPSALQLAGTSGLSCRLAHAV